jgi:hypothetical protein
VTDSLGVFFWTRRAIHICKGHLASAHGRLQNRNVDVAIKPLLKPPTPLPDPGGAAVFQKLTQTDQVESVILYAMIFGMLKRMGVHGQKVDCAVGRIGIFFRLDLLEKRHSEHTALASHRPS